jgi:hypothetical protein
VVIDVRAPFEHGVFLMSKRVLVTAAAISGLAACGTTRLYPGPKRPDTEVAAIETQKVVVLSVDKRAVTAGRARFEVLAGMHSVLLRRDKTTRAFCLMARGGHAYLVRPVKAEGIVWFPEVIDENTTSVIPTKTTSPVAPDCSPESSRSAEDEGD